MKTIKPNAEYVWKQCEDVLVQRLHFSAVDRVVYTHLVRHSRMEGKLRLRFSIPWLARGVGLSTDTVRQAVRRLVEHGALNLLERSKAGHVVDVRLPMEIPAVRARSIEDRRPMEPGRDVSLEEIDFLQTRTLRGAIHARESGVCFYCLKGTLIACGASTTWCHERGKGAILIATWFPPASNATARKENARQRTISAGCTANVA
jgi:hypothetical protein